MTTAELEWKQRVSRSFDLAADDYDQHALVQKQAADSLFQWLTAEMPETDVERGLEIGCGTGFLTRHLVESFPGSDWLITDASSEMVRHCASRFAGNRRTRFQVMDGEIAELLDQESGLDLICSSLAFQWFVDLPGALRNLTGYLNPGGWLVFSTLAKGNFQQIARAIADGGWSWGESETAIEQFVHHQGYHIRTEERSFDQSWPDHSCFLQSLKRIGAGTPRQDNRIDSRRLRAAIRKARQTNESLIADYRILFVAIQKKAV